MRTRKKPRAQRAPRRPVVRAPAPVMVRLEDLNAAAYNPRLITDEEMLALKASLVKHGFVEPLVVQKKGTMLIGGHQRVAALRELAEEGKVRVPELVPAVVLDVSDAVAMQLNITLNRVGGEFDAHKLGLVLAQVVSDPTFDALPLGFAQDQVVELVRQATATPEELARQLEREAAELDVFARSVTLTVNFETVAQRDEAKQLLGELAEARGEKAGALLLRLVKQVSAARRPRRRATA